MTEAENVEANVVPGEALLDPFEYMPAAKSRIVGLGGSDVPPDGEYAFHTSYVPVAEGPATFRVRFDRLSATYGELTLRVHRLGGRSGSDAVLANSAKVQLDRIASNGTTISIRFEGFQDVRYALYGGITGPTDAAAEGLSVILDRPFDPARVRSTVVEARNTAFGSDGLKPTAHLGSERRASLTSPICQIATQAQLDEPVAAEWIGQAGLAGIDPCDQWSLIYIAQVLSTYGMLQEGARGLALRSRSPVLLAQATSRGVEMVDACQPPIALEGLPGSGDAAGAAPVEAGEAAAVDAGAEAPDGAAAQTPVSLTDELAEQVNFDFLWSLDTGEDLYSAKEVSEFVRYAIGCLRPGGVAVHVVRFAYGDTNDRCFSKQRIDQLALGVISAGHEIAQIRLLQDEDILWETPDGSGVPIARVGLLIRRARLLA